MMADDVITNNYLNINEQENHDSGHMLRIYFKMNWKSFFVDLTCSQQFIHYLVK